MLTFSKAFLSIASPLVKTKVCNLFLGICLIAKVGIVALTISAESANVFVLILLILSAIVIFFNLVQFLKSSLLILSPLLTIIFSKFSFGRCLIAIAGTLALIKLLQPSKILSPKSFTLLGIVIPVMPLQLSNAPASIFAT